MGIDAQRSGASELPVRAVEVRRAQGATTKAIPVWIVEEEQRSDRPHSGPCNLRRTDDGRAPHSGPGNLRHADDGRAQQDPCALRVAAEPGPRYRALGAAAARPGGHLARPPLPPQAAVGGPGRCWRPSTMHIDIACGPPPTIWPRGARNAALCTFTTDSYGTILRHVREIGVVEAQFMDSILPFASFPQAVACAARAAARSEVADAFAQLRRPRNSTQTSHRYCCAAS